MREDSRDGRLEEINLGGALRSLCTRSKARPPKGVSDPVAYRPPGGSWLLGWWMRVSRANDRRFCGRGFWRIRSVGPPEEWGTSQRSRSQTRSPNPPTEESIDVDRQTLSRCPVDHSTAAPAGNDIVDTAVAAGSFKTLVKAVQAAELVDVLKGEGPFTVFAPTDEAFAKIPAADLNALIKDKKALTSVLTYHVVPGRIMAKDVLKTSWAKTAQGQSLWVHMDGKAPMIDGAKIVKTDIECSNGVIHVIDAVVMPRKDIVDTAVGAGSFKTLVAAVQGCGPGRHLEGRGTVHRLRTHR